MEQGQTLDTQAQGMRALWSGFCVDGGRWGRLSPPPARHCHLCLLLSVSVFLFVQLETTCHPVASLRTEGPCLLPQVSARCPCGRRPTSTFTSVSAADPCRSVISRGQLSWLAPKIGFQILPGEHCAGTKALLPHSHPLKCCFASRTEPLPGALTGALVFAAKSGCLRCYEGLLAGLSQALAAQVEVTVSKGGSSGLPLPEQAQLTYHVCVCAWVCRHVCMHRCALVCMYVHV